MVLSLMSPRCTSPSASRASPSAPSLTTTISGLVAPRSVSVANRSARAKSARVSVGFSAATAASSSVTSPVRVESGVTTESICATSIRSAPDRPRAISRTFSCADPNRVGATSVACIEALASTSTTTLRPSSRAAAGRGSPSAMISSSSSASWSSSDSSRLSCENRLVASWSRSTRRQSGAKGTATERRRIFRM